MVALLGDPVAHSLSPRMHNAAFADAGLNWRYVAFRIPAEDLAGALRAVSALTMVGCNVTIPHKEAAFGAVDDLDPVAAQVGAVNTVRVTANRLQGFNTDTVGILDTLMHDGRAPLDGCAAVVIGAGGGARAAAFALAGHAKRVVILNRTVSRGRGLAQRVAAAYPQCALDAADLSAGSIAAALDGADVLIQATSATLSAAMGGAGGRAEWLDAVEEQLRPGITVLDMVYTPPRTELLAAAETAGAKAISGLALLVHQGARSFELWTGRPAPVDVMRRAVGL
ncbi:MAG: shikimate dehydrogenase [bacterium]